MEYLPIFNNSGFVFNNNYWNMVMKGGESFNLDQLIHSFNKKYCITKSGCWIWIGAKISSGYGNFRVGYMKKNVLAHRFSYEFYNGKIEEPLVIDHLCHKRLCVNPKHLEAVTMKENLKRGFSPAAIRSREGYCVMGHEYNNKNTRIYFHPNGKERRRICRECNRLYYIKYRAKRKTISSP